MNNNSQLLNSDTYWHRYAWNEGGYSIGVLIRIGALINKNAFEVGALIGMKLVR